MQNQVTSLTQSNWCFLNLDKLIIDFFVPKQFCFHELFHLIDLDPFFLPNYSNQPMSFSSKNQSHSGELSRNKITIIIYFRSWNVFIPATFTFTHLCKFKKLVESQGQTPLSGFYIVLVKMKVGFRSHWNENIINQKTFLVYAQSQLTSLIFSWTSIL